ncbi:hypothetical protein [Bradyrhizobium sp. CCBAU 65884]|uniref:hypothetical protein n=1 Tax=Bradyrhizobium sp. CCBAU 65884 TaxID=722477 RepID=UPI002305A2BE|nr:hypothetical protein [Bradyrhizobium sp. CCBAU 65884]
MTAAAAVNAVLANSALREIAHHVRRELPTPISNATGRPDAMNRQKFQTGNT